MAGVAAQGPRHASPRRVHEAVRRPGLRASAHGMGRSRGRGFTLLEMLVVMVIIAAAMLLGVMATTGGTERMQLHSSTKQIAANLRYTRAHAIATGEPQRSAEHTSELQSLMRTTYADFCLKKTIKQTQLKQTHN